MSTCIYAFLVLNNKLHIYNFSTWIDTVRNRHCEKKPHDCFSCSLSTVQVDIDISHS